MNDYKFDEPTNWYNEEECLEEVKKNGKALYFVKNKTEEICREAVLQNYEAIRYVECKNILVNLMREFPDVLLYMDKGKYIANEMAKMKLEIKLKGLK